MNEAPESLIPSQPINYIHTLYEAVKHREDEETVSFSYLMGISGEAFRFFYNRAAPEAGINTFFHNPLRAACKALGFNFEISYDETYQAAWERLRENMSAGKPALLPFPDCCPFLMEGKQPEEIIYQNGSRHQIRAEDVEKKWQPGGGFLELGPHGYYQFVIGSRDREPKARDVALGALRGAIKMMNNRRTIRDCAMGLAAYEALIADLSGVSKRPTEHDIDKIAKWSETPLTQCIEAREAAFKYLKSVREHFEAEEQAHLDKAIAAYQAVVVLLKKVQQVLGNPAAPSSQSQAIRRFRSNCRMAVKPLKKVLSAETAGIGEMESIVQISEKVKM